MLRGFSPWDKLSYLLAWLLEERKAYPRGCLGDQHSRIFLPIGEAVFETEKGFFEQVEGEKRQDERAADHNNSLNEKRESVLMSEAPYNVIERQPESHEEVMEDVEAIAVLSKKTKDAVAKKSGCDRAGTECPK